MTPQVSKLQVLKQEKVNEEIKDVYSTKSQVRAKSEMSKTIEVTSNKLNKTFGPIIAANDP